MSRIGILGLICCALVQLTVVADGDGDALYLHRSRMMEASSSHLKALQAYVKGELAIKDHVSTHVDALLALNAMYQDLFPAGEQHPESEALPMIWSDSRGFQQAIQHNRQRIMALKQVNPGDVAMLKRAVNEVRMSCGDCHYYFRQR